MCTVLDYIKYYKDISIKDVKWNTLDNLICAMLGYLPIKPFNTRKTIRELLEYSKDKVETTAYSAPHALELLSLISNSKRYQNLLIEDFSIYKNEDIQFGAMKVKIDKKTIIIFEGTDGSYIGWLENFRLCYAYPTKTQEYAAHYLKRIINYKDNDIDIVGHSKGGNLAITSSMELDKKLLKMVNKIYSFDGPGLKKEEYTSIKYQNIKDKVINIITNNSYVGILFFSDNYRVIKSSSNSFTCHDPFTWNTYGTFFIPGKLSNISKRLHNTVIKGLNEVDKDILKNTFESLLINMDKEYQDKFVIDLESLKNLIKNYKNIDPNIAKYLILIINTLIEGFVSKK